MDIGGEWRKHIHMELYAYNFLAILEENRLYRLSPNYFEILTNIKTIQA